MDRKAPVSLDRPENGIVGKVLNMFSSFAVAVFQLEF
jgi:hypothetical protein